MHRTHPLRFRPYSILLCALLLLACSGPQETTEPIEDKDGTQAAAPDLVATGDVPEEEPVDPYLWLEDVEGEKSMAWVKARNAESLGVLEKDPRFAILEAQAQEILDATDRIPYGGLLNGYIYNFWRDEKNERGLWRRVPKRKYLKKNAKWETLIDLDKLAEAEGENWVWKGANCLPPKFETCLVTLSQGGKDASVQREFDVSTKKFVEGGFELPEGKNRTAWIDKDTLLVGVDSGEGSVTASGYPRTLQLWTRGQVLAEAPTLFEVAPEDISVWPWVQHEPGGGVITILYRGITFFSGSLTLASADLKEQVLLPLPEHLSPEGIFQKQLLATLREPWTPPGGREFKAGTLVAIDLRPYLDIVEGRKDYEVLPEPWVEALLEPDDKTSVQRIQMTPDAVLVEQLIDVKPHIERYEYVATNKHPWTHAPVELPSNVGTGFIVSASEYESDVYFRQETPIQAQSLYHRDEKSDGWKLLASLPARFDAEGMEVHAHRAISADGTEVPYFVVTPTGWKQGDTLPTYLHAYGGFEVSMLPYYRSLTGKLWLERGGIFALANIRGGGEYGPRWHQAALKQNRQRAFDDFHAVAEDLVAQGYTTADKLGIRGGSNGGLLMGVAVTQRPELYGAAIIDVPLLDMLRYHKLLAGASWVGEYGDPEIPEEREVLKAYSPYQNVKADGDYPRVFITTSTADDRVHPGHARKMVARMLEQGHDLYYFENIEGGHGGVANNKQRAFVSALKFVYFMRELGLGETPEPATPVESDPVETPVRPPG